MLMFYHGKMENLLSVWGSMTPDIILALMVIVSVKDKISQLIMDNGIKLMNPN